MLFDRPFIGDAETLLNQAAEMQLTLLYHAAAEDDEVPALSACQALAGWRQLDAAMRHVRPEAEDGDVTAMKVLVRLSKEAGDEETAARWARRAGEAGDGWAMSEYARSLRKAGRLDEAERWSRAAEPREFSAAFERFAAELAGRTIQQQEAFNEYWGSGYCRFDLLDRTITNEERGLALGGVTFLGTFSHLSRTWLWSWANPEFGWDHPAVAPLRPIHETGTARRIPEFTVGMLNLAGFPNPHQAATTMVIAAAALLRPSGVWTGRIDEGRGSAYVHIDDPRIPVPGFVPASAPGLLETAIEVFPADPRLVVRGYLAHHGLRVEETESRISALMEEGGTFSVEFDESGAIRSTRYDE